MKHEEYQKVKKIFQAAIELVPVERAVFLDKECKEDGNLRFEVERLLGNEDPVFLEKPAMAQMADAVIKAEYEEDLSKFLAESQSNGHLSHYKIIKKIGHGGMGEVYLADDTRLNRKVAIKVLSKEFSQDAERLKRFVQEAKSASALNHPNIITVFETREEKEIYYVVNEYIDGETLAKKISQEKIDLLSVINIAIQTVSALAAAHEAGIIHRDIKPDNVMIRRDGIVKVLDFGLATTEKKPNKVVNRESETVEQVVTEPGMILGTPQYMSPEQASGEKADARTDIFSFGILLYEMITGKPPFFGKNQIEVLAAILKEEPLPIEESAEDVPDNLKRIIGKTLQKDPKKRYQNSKDLLNDLKEIKDELKFEAKLSLEIHRTNSKAIARNSQELASQGRRFLFVQVALLVLVAGVIAASVWWFVFANGSVENHTKNSFSVAEITNWSSSPGELFSTGAFSPDGKTIAFSSTRAGEKSIWIKQTSSGDAVQITKDDFENNYPVWSPNGEEIAFISTRDGATGIWRIPAFGGLAKPVTTFKDAGAELKRWTQSGKIYYESEQNLFAFDTETNQTKQLTDFDKKTENIHKIAVSQDEKQIAYITNDEEKWKISVKKIGDSAPSEVITLDSEINTIKWHSDGKRVLYSVLKNGIFQIFVIGIGGSEPVQVTFGEKDSVVQSVSADGGKILFGSAREDSNLWYVDVEKAEDNLFNADINSELWQAVSPDNQTVVFQSIKNLSQANKLLSGEIFTKKISADSPSVQLAENGFLPKVSADGKTISYLKLVGEKTEIWTVKNSGGNSKLLANEGIDIIGFTISPYNPIETTYYSWSPVSNEIAYISDKKDGANIWLVSSDGSSDKMLTNYKDDDLLLFSPIWSSDGKRIAFYSISNKLNSAGKTVRVFWIYDTESKETSKVFETDKIARLIGFSENEKELIYASTNKFSSLPPEVFLYSVSSPAVEKKLLHTLKSSYYYNIHLSPDRKQVAFVSRSGKNDDVWIVPTKGANPKVLTNNHDPRLYFSSLSWSPDGKLIFFGKQTRFSILSMISDFKFK